MSSYIGVSPFSQTVRTTTSVTAANNQTLFYPTGGYITGYLDVTINGVKLVEGTDYSAGDGVSVTLTTATSNNDVVQFTAFGAITFADSVKRSGDTLTGTMLVSDVIPISDNTYSLGNNTNRFANLYLSGNTIIIGNGTISANTTHVAFKMANGETMPLAANLNASLPNTGVTANTYGNTTAIPVITVDGQGRITNASTSSVSVVTGVSYAASNSTITVSTPTTNFNALINSANSTTQGLIKVDNTVSNSSSDVAASAFAAKSAYELASNAVSNAVSYAANAYANATSYADTVSGTAYTNAVSTANTTSFNQAANAYTNATSYAANASNISSGTLDTARLPATANVATAVNVGANVNLTTSTISVGNSTVNTSITSSALTTTSNTVTIGTSTYFVANGNVGIGTSSPGARLESRVSRTSGTNTTALILSDNVTGIQTSGFGTQIRGLSNNGAAVSAIGFEAYGGTNNDTAIAFYTQSTAASLTRRVTIDSSGTLILAQALSYALSNNSGTTTIGRAVIDIAQNTTTSLLSGYHGSLALIKVNTVTGNDVQVTFLVTHGWNSASVLFTNHYGSSTPTFTFSASSGSLQVNHNSNGTLRFRVSAILGGA